MERYSENISNQENLTDDSEWLKVDGFYYDEIRNLIAPISEIIPEIKDNIENGEYSYIVGDDASGRIPALIFWNLLKDLYREKGFDKPSIYFIAGSGNGNMAGLDRSEKTEKIDEYISSFLREHQIEIEPEESLIAKFISLIRNLKNERVDGETGGRILIVTDIMSSGKSLEPLTQALRKNNLKFDIATMASKFKGKLKEKREKDLGAHIYDTKRGSIDIYDKPSISGVYKKPEEILAKPYMTDQKNINVAREDVKVATNKLLDFYHEKIDTK